MTIFPLKAFSDNYIWTISDKSSEHFTCVDPGDAAPVIDFATASHKTLNKILLTHHHADHIGGVNELMVYFPNLKVFGPEDARIPQVNHRLKDDQRILIGDYAFTILETPGHTSTHICYYEEQNKWLFCGDTLFSAGCGRVFDGTVEELFHSLKRLKDLDEETKLFCAHEYTADNLKFAAMISPNNSDISAYQAKITQDKIACTLPSTLGFEKKINPFLRTDEKDIRYFAEQHQLDSSDELTVFTLLRLLKDNF